MDGELLETQLPRLVGQTNMEEAQALQRDHLGCRGKGGRNHYQEGNNGKENGNCHLGFRVISLIWV